MCERQSKGSAGGYKEVDCYLDVINSGNGVTLFDSGKVFSFGLQATALERLH